jgi:hypothetical protein
MTSQIMIWIRFNFYNLNIIKQIIQCSLILTTNITMKDN